VRFALFAFWVAAFVNDPPLKAFESEAPPIEVGVLAGRDGVAFGPGILLQGHLRRLGLYGFAGTSSITGYSTSDGVTANLRDRTLGFGIQYRIVRLGKHFAISGFGQAAYMRYGRTSLTHKLGGLPLVSLVSYLGGIPSDELRSPSRPYRAITTWRRPFPKEGRRQNGSIMPLSSSAAKRTVVNLIVTPGSA